MKKFLAVTLLAMILFSSCGRRVYLNESNKITVSQKRSMSPKPKNSNLWLAILITVPNLIFFGSTISNQTSGR